MNFWAHLHKIINKKENTKQALDDHRYHLIRMNKEQAL